LEQEIETGSETLKIGDSQVYRNNLSAKLENFSPPLTD
jgi:hypothetical protein